MKQHAQREGLTPDGRLWNIQAWEALLTGLLAVTRARDRGEPYWALDVRRAQARIAAQRAQSRRSIKPPVE